MRCRPRSVAACRGRPLAYTQPVALQARVGRVDLQLEGGELGCFLLFAIELLKAGFEALGEEESHGIGRQQLLPDAVKVWQSTELFISGDQRPATVKCRGRDQAISWIAMLKQGAA